MVDDANDVRIIGVITLVALTGFTFFGMEIASKVNVPASLGITLVYNLLMLAKVNLWCSTVATCFLHDSDSGYC